MKSKSRNKNIEFYRGRRVLVTGHTGFKGTWLIAILNYLGANVLGYALEPPVGGLYQKIKGDDLVQSVIGDLNDVDKLDRAVEEFKPEVVLHLAAFGFVNECYQDPVKAYQTNLMGTLRLLEALRSCETVKSIVLVSTDKVYENEGNSANYQESDRLGGIGPYAGSKTCMEILANDYKETYFQNGMRNIGIATARASNVLGGGDHIETRLIPTILKAASKGRPVELRNPEQTRPWQSVLDALNGYLSIARLLYNSPEEYSEAWNIGPTVDGIKSVGWVFDKINASFKGLQTTSGEKFDIKESKTLGLNIRKSLSFLDWEPYVSVERTIEMVVEFYKFQQAGEWERDICMRQIKEFYGGSNDKELEK